MTKNIVTLYIDDTNLRLMVTRGRRIKKYAELPLNLGLAKLSDNIKEAELAAKIKQLFKSQKVRGKKVIVGLSGLHCLTRPITLPQLPRAMLAEAVMREAKRILPVPAEQLYISWQIIGATEDNIQIFLAAIPCRTADTVLKILRQGGLKPYLVDLKPLALARMARESTAVIVDVQTTEFDIVIMSDGIPQPIRTVLFPSKKLPQQEKLLTVRAELKRTIEFFNSNNPEKPLDSSVPILVSGELAKEPELHDALSNEVGHPVLSISSPLKHPKELDPTPYLVNIGLALKELEKEAGPSVVNLNLLPAPYRTKPIPWFRIIAAPATIAVISLIVLLSMFIQGASANIASLQAQLDSSQHILKYKQSQKAELVENITQLEQRIAATKASHDTFTAVLTGLDEQGDGTNGDLETTINCLLSSINLTRISHTQDMLTVSGRAPNEAEVLAYARNLDNSGQFSGVTIASLTRVVAEEVEEEIEGEDESQSEGEGEDEGQSEGEGEDEDQSEGEGEDESQSEGEGEDEGQSEGEGEQVEGDGETEMEFILVLKPGEKD